MYIGFIMMHMDVYNDAHAPTSATGPPGPARQAIDVHNNRCAQQSVCTTVVVYLNLCAKRQAVVVHKSLCANLKYGEKNLSMGPRESVVKWYTL